MVFGDKNRFAVAFELDDDPGGAWMFGRFCYWINGEAVGDWSRGVSLRDVLFQIKCIVGDQGKRSCPALLQLSREEIFRLIGTCLDEASDDLFHFISRDFLPARFDVCIPIDIFDKWRIYAVDGGDESRIVYGDESGSHVYEAKLSLGEFDRVMYSAYSALDSLYCAVAET